MRRRATYLVLALLVLLGPLAMRRTALNAMMYFPSSEMVGTPQALGLAYQDVSIATEDGERLGAWWVPKVAGPSRAPILYCHGNGGNISGRVEKLALLARHGFDTLMFDYRGYGASTGRPSEEGTYEDARAARKALLALPGVEAARVIYLGESLGGAVALQLALESPPRGLVLQSTYTSIRDEARVHYGRVPLFLIPDAYPSIDRIGALRCPLLMVHGDRDDIVPFSQGERLFAAAPEPKRFERLEGVGHNDLVARAGTRYMEILAAWVEALPSTR